MSKRRKYSAEFKREAVALTRQPGVSASQIAREIGVNPNMIYRWRREDESPVGQAFQGTGTPRDQELMRLKRELVRVQKERDFLVKAATFFAKESS